MTKRVAQDKQRVAKEFDPAADLPVPKTFEEAVAQRNAWCATAAQSLRNAEYWEKRALSAESVLRATQAQYATFED